MAKRAPHIEVHRHGKIAWWRLVAANSKIMAVSETYASHRNAKRAATSAGKQLRLEVRVVD